MEIPFAMVCILLFLVVFFNEIQKLNEDYDTIRKRMEDRDR